MTAPWSLPPDLHCVTVDGRVCIYAPARAEVSVLNESAAMVWRSAPGLAGEAAVAGAVAELTGLLEKDVRADVEHVLAELVGLGLLVQEHRFAP